MDGAVVAFLNAEVEEDVGSAVADININNQTLLISYRHLQPRPPPAVLHLGDQFQAKK